MRPNYDGSLFYRMAQTVTHSRAARGHAHEAIAHAIVVWAEAKAIVQELKVHREHLQALRVQGLWLPRP